MRYKVKNIASQTSEKEVRDFFSFWYVLSPPGPLVRAADKKQWENHLSFGHTRFQGREQCPECNRDIRERDVGVPPLNDMVPRTDHVAERPRLPFS